MSWVNAYKNRGIFFTSDGLVYSRLNIPITVEAAIENGMLPHNFYELHPDFKINDRIDTFRSQNFNPSLSSQNSLPPFRSTNMNRSFPSSSAVSSSSSSSSLMARPISPSMRPTISSRQIPTAPVSPTRKPTLHSQSSSISPLSSRAFNPPTRYFDSPDQQDQQDHQMLRNNISSRQGSFGNLVDNPEYAHMTDDEIFDLAIKQSALEVPEHRRNPFFDDPADDDDLQAAIAASLEAARYENTNDQLLSPRTRDRLIRQQQDIDFAEALRKDSRKYDDMSPPKSIRPSSPIRQIMLPSINQSSSSRIPSPPKSPKSVSFADTIKSIDLSDKIELPRTMYPIDRVANSDLLRFRFRLPDGSTVTHSFHRDEPFRTLVAFIQYDIQTRDNIRLFIGSEPIRCDIDHMVGSCNIPPRTVINVEKV